MPNIDTTFTKTYVFGIADDNAPDIDGIDMVTSAEVRYEPEVFVTATDGTGHATALARTPAKATGTFTGYTSSGSATVGLSFQWDSRTWITKSIGESRKKGEFVELSVEAESFAGVTGG